MTMKVNERCDGKGNCGREKEGPPSINTEADNIINGERLDMYGAPEDSFGLVARYWDTYLRACSTSLNSRDVAHMMVLFKMARCQGQIPSRDNYVDICGYAGIAGDRLMGIPKERDDG